MARPWRRARRASFDSTGPAGAKKSSSSPWPRQAARSGLGPVCSPLFLSAHGLCRARLERDPSARRSPTVQDRPVQASPYSGLGPDPEPAVHRRGRGTETRRQMPPRATADQHVHDRCNTASSSIFAAPPPCGRTRAAGNNGSTSSHSPFGTIQSHLPPLTPRSTIKNHVGHGLRTRLGSCPPPASVLLHPGRAGRRTR